MLRCPPAWPEPCPAQAEWRVRGLQRWPPRPYQLRKAHAISCDKHLVALSSSVHTPLFIAYQGQFKAPRPLQRDFRPVSLLRLSPNMLSRLSLLESARPLLPTTPSPSQGAAREVSSFTSQHYRIPPPRGPTGGATYMKGTHLQRLAGFIPLSQNRSEIASPLCNITGHLHLSTIHATKG